MKVNIYRVLFFVLVGLMAGFAIGSYMTTKVLLNNLPPTTEVSIGKIKMRGRDNVAEIEMSPTTEEVVEPSGRVRRRDRK